VWTRRFARLRDRVGVACRLHDLRHFMCTQLMAAGVDLVTVAGRAGHADGRMVVEVYAHFQPARDQKAAALLAERCDQPAADVVAGVAPMVQPVHTSMSRQPAAM
jgi:integrase